MNIHIFWLLKNVIMCSRLPGIRNRVAIVNGAASGIGQGICLSLFEQGADVVCVDLKSAEKKAHETLRLLKQARPGGRCTFMACDVLDRAQIEVGLRRMNTDTRHYVYVHEILSSCVSREHDSPITF